MKIILRIDWQCKKCKKLYNVYRYRYRPNHCERCNGTDFVNFFVYYRSWECRGCGRRITTQRGNDRHPNGICFNCQQNNWSRIPLLDKPRKPVIRRGPDGFVGQGGEIKEINKQPLPHNASNSLSQG
jgi:hypothetical protein